MHTFLIQIVEAQPKFSGQRHANLVNGKWKSRVMELTGETPESCIDNLKNTDVKADTWNLIGVCE